MTLGEGVAIIRVWKRPDLTREEGAALALEMVEAYRRVAREPLVRGMVADFREATTSWGPVTQAALGQMFSALEAANKRLALVVANDAVQMMAVVSLLKEYAPTFGRVFRSDEDAVRWAGVRR